MIRANFKVKGSTNVKDTSNTDIVGETKTATKADFEEFVARSGAIGSFMIYRSTKKEEELGLDEL